MSYITHRNSGYGYERTELTGVLCRIIPGKYPGYYFVYIPYGQNITLYI